MFNNKNIFKLGVALKNSERAETYQDRQIVLEEFLKNRMARTMLVIYTTQLKIINDDSKPYVYDFLKPNVRKHSVPDPILIRHKIQDHLDKCEINRSQGKDPPLLRGLYRYYNDDVLFNELKNSYDFTKSLQHNLIRDPNELVDKKLIVVLRDFTSCTKKCFDNIEFYDKIVVFDNITYKNVPDDNI